MNNVKKHTDVVATIEEFEIKLNNGTYVSPWVVYVGNENDGYKVFYSNDEKQDLNIAEPDFTEILINRIKNLEEEKVYCYEEEYEKLVTETKGWVTGLDGTRKEVSYDENKTYCIYEEEGPLTNE
jgi:hypothetical protein